MSDRVENGDPQEWVPIGADYEMGGWKVLWARWTPDGWEFREGKVGAAHTQIGTPGGVLAGDDDE